MLCQLFLNKTGEIFFNVKSHSLGQIEPSKQPLVGIVQPVISEIHISSQVLKFKKSLSNDLVKPIDISLVFS